LRFFVRQLGVRMNRAPYLFQLIVKLQNRIDQLHRRFGKMEMR